MTPEDEGFLADVYNLLNKRAIDPTSEQYVELYSPDRGEAIAGPDAVRLLGRTLTMTTPGEAFFLTGLRGSGKTVQLKRLKMDLERRGFAVVMFSAEDYLNMHEPLNVVDVLFFLVGAISDTAVDDGLLAEGDAAERHGWARLRSWMANLPSRISLTGMELGVEAGVPEVVKGKASLKGELRRDPSFVAGLREFLEGRLNELVTEANRIVADLVTDIRKRWDRGEWRGLVVIVDSLDHNRAVDSEKFQQVRRALVNLFDKDYDNLRRPDCRTVFTLPLYVQVAGNRTVRRVTNVKVAEKDGKPNEAGAEALRDVLRQRVPGRDLLRIFPSAEAVDDLVRASGGHLRILLGLAMEVVTQAESLPVDEATITSAIEQVRNGMLPLADDQRAMLRRVAEDHQLPLETQESWDVASTLLDQHFVLGFQNGDVWFDVHPLLRTEIGNGRP